jgi:hypothetical protein
MKKIVLTCMAVVMTVAGVFAQNIFFSTKEGTKLCYANLDAKKRATSYSLQTIKKVEGSGDNMTIVYGMRGLDKNRRPMSDNPAEIPCTITIRNGVMEWDMRMFGEPGTESFLQVEGDKLRIPTSLAPGTKLDDVAFTLTINMGIRIRTEITLTEQECLAVEDITVPAGSFKCYKLTQTSSATAMRRTMVTKIITWYAPGVGQVKSETFDAKDKLQSATELFSIE